MSGGPPVQRVEGLLGQPERPGGIRPELPRLQRERPGGRGQRLLHPR